MAPAQDLDISVTRDVRERLDAVIADVVADLLKGRGLERASQAESEMVVYDGLLQALSYRVKGHFAEFDWPGQSAYDTQRHPAGELDAALDALFASLASQIDSTVQWPSDTVNMGDLLLPTVVRCQRQARSRFNTSRPFNRLPTDIGRCIFILALIQDQPRLTYYIGLHHLRLVCTQWYQFIDTYPAFWTLLSSQPPRPTWRLILEKSQQSPLLLDFQPLKKIPNQSTQVSRLEFLETAAAEIHRVKSLRFSPGWWREGSALSEGESSALKSILESDAPLLEALHLDCGELYPGTKVRYVMGLPRLNVLGLSGWTKSLLTGCTFKHLEALHIGTSHPPVHLQLLWEIVTAAPSLIHLNVYGGLEEDVALPVVRTCTTLTSLRTLNLSDVSPATISLILSLFLAPHCDYISLSGPKWAELPDDLFKHLAPHITTVVQNRQSPSAIRIRCWTVYLALNDKLFNLWGSTEWDDPNVMRRILEHIPPSLTQSVPVCISIEEDIDEDILPLLDSPFPNIIELSLPRSSTLHPRKLGTPQTADSGGPPRYLFPHLRRLKLCGRHPSTEYLRRAVQIAAWRSQARLIDGCLVPAAPLESIHVTPDTPYKTPCFRKILREARGVVRIECDAPSKLAKHPKARHFFSLASSHSPLYPPDDGMHWVETITEPVVEIVEPREYDVSTSDEEEAAEETGTDDDEDDDE